MPAVVFLAVAVRVVWILLVPAQPVSDFYWYYKTGVTLAQGGGYASNGMPTATFPVGYPLFLALLFSFAGPSVIAAKAANLALVIIALLVVRRLGAVLFGSEAIGRIGMLIYAFLPDGIFWASQLASEPLLNALALGGCLMILAGPHRLWKVAVGGLLFGLAVLVRPVGIVLPFVPLVAGLLGNRRVPDWGGRFTEFACLVVMMVVVLTPWTVRNYRVFGGFVPLSTSGGFNLVIGHNPVASGQFQRDYATFQMVSEPYRTACASNFDKYVREPNGPALLGATHETLNELTIDRECRKVAIQYMMANPLREVGLFLKKVWLLYRADGGGVHYSLGETAQRNPHLDTARTWARRFSLLAWLLVLGSFLGSIIVLPQVARRKGALAGPGFPLFGLVYVVLFTAFTCMFYASGRYYAPMVPWTCLYVGALISWLFDLERAWRPQKAVVLMPRARPQWEGAPDALRPSRPPGRQPDPDAGSAPAPIPNGGVGEASQVAGDGDSSLGSE